MSFFLQNTTLDIPFYALDRKNDLDHQYAETAWKLTSQLGLNNLVLVSDNLLAMQYFRQKALRKHHCILDSVYINKG